MPDVFVSYKRDDMKRVATLIEVLRARGLDVWWDQDIAPSDPWETTTERALEDATAVVVCWSPGSVVSEAVRAEARRGRAREKLLQLYLAPCDPPLFFGERQGIELFDWDGDAQDRRIGRLADAVRALAAAPPAPSSDVAGQAIAPGSTQDQSATRPEARSRAPLPQWAKYGAIVVVLLAAALGVWISRPESTSVPSLAVVAQSGAGADDLAAGLTADLTRLAAVHADDLRLVGGNNADYLIRVSLSGLEPDRADVSLVARGSDELLWSQSFEAPGGVAAGLRPAISAKLSELLLCAIRLPGISVLRGADRRFFLSACNSADSPGTASRLATLRQLNERQPGFAQGWAERALTEALLSVGDPLAPTAEQGRMAKAALEHAEKAQSLDPGLGEPYVAQAYLLPPGQWLRRLELLDRGIEIDPDLGLLHFERSTVLRKLGRLNEALASLARAAELEPLSAFLAAEQAIVQIESGAGEPGRQRLVDVERTWPDSRAAREARFYYEFRYGRGPAALALFEEGKTEFGGNTPWGPLPTLKALAEPTPQNRAAAIKWLTVDTRGVLDSVPQRIQNLAILDAVDEVPGILAPPGALAHLQRATQVLFPMHMQPLQRDPRFIRIAADLGLVKAWEQSGVWPDFCLDPRLPYDCQAEARKIERS